MIEQDIKRYFIPLRAPNFEKIWKASVQIESTLNSRSLTNLSNDPNDLSYLSPGYFLIEDAFTAIPETTLLDMLETRLNRWQKVEQIKQHF